MCYYLVWALWHRHLEVTAIVMTQQWYILNAVSSVEVFSGGRWEKISWSQRRRWWWHERGRRRLPAPRWGQDRSSEFYHHFHFLDRSSEFHKELFQTPLFYHHSHLLLSLSRLNTRVSKGVVLTETTVLPPLSLSRTRVKTWNVAGGGQARQDGGSNRQASSKEWGSPLKVKVKENKCSRGK